MAQSRFREHGLSVRITAIVHRMSLLSW